MKLHHHAMVVPDLDAAIDCHSALGMCLLRRKPGIAFREVAMLQDTATGRCIELLWVDDAPESRFEHVAFEVEDVDADFAKMLAQGFTSAREPFDVGDGSVRTSFLTAPDGTKVELIRYGRSNPAPDQIETQT